MVCGGGVDPVNDKGSGGHDDAMVLDVVAFATLLFYGTVGTSGTKWLCNVPETQLDNIFFKIRPWNLKLARFVGDVYKMEIWSWTLASSERTKKYPFAGCCSFQIALICNILINASLFVREEGKWYDDTLPIKRSDNQNKFHISLTPPLSSMVHSNGGACLVD